ncbi:MAG: protein-L-isoaspartate O-methyltransferase [Anaerolineaceae bacterium 4572_32.1]|nr:MAG: protein-L-isoaspartate O-methyltransferase [Anaerolineaceae bacterium 4572_32.1]
MPDEKWSDYSTMREQMVCRQIEARGIRDERLLSVMRAIPRHLFVPEKSRRSAYRDGPLPIGQGQTISQPYIVALMTEALELKGQERVLEIGTGSGYQAAILSQLASFVYTVERIPELVARTQELFNRLGYANILMRLSDGTLGWPEHAPYDAIVVTAASPDVPEPLTEQLIEGGRLVAPVGGSWSQLLIRIRKQGGHLQHQEITNVAFVPLVGKHGWPEKS